MSKCVFNRTLLEDHLNGELPEPQEDEVKEHLRGCSECSDWVEAQVMQLVHLVLLSPGRKPPEGFTGRVMEGVRSDPHRTPA